jgi:hypothetical protein
VPPHPDPERTFVPLPAGGRRAPLDLEFDLPPPPETAEGEVWADVDLESVEEPYGVGAADVELGEGDGGEARLREALSLASRDVVERIAWEVVPQLAETIIREQLERLIASREQNR